MDRTDLVDNPKFSDSQKRCMNELELKAIIAEWVKNYGTMEMLGMGDAYLSALNEKSII